jgi:hypothetical protein
LKAEVVLGPYFHSGDCPISLPQEIRSFRRGVFRRYHVENNPVNRIDPSGLVFIVDDALAIAALQALTTAVLADVLLRANPNIKGSTPNYKKPNGKPNTGT